MVEQQNTLACQFALRSPLITAFHVHEWIHETMNLTEDDVRMIQIDGPRRRVYMKFVTNARMLKVLQDTKGTLEYRHDNGEQSYVKIEIAGMGTRDIRLAALPSKIHDRVIKEVLSKYGEVTEMKEEQ
jgi:hypothetical protein